MKVAKCRKVKQVIDELKPHHKANRIVWYFDALWIKKDPMHVEYTLFSDECVIYLDRSNSLFSGEKWYDCDWQSHNVANKAQGIMLLGVISAMGPGFLVTVQGYLNSIGYRNLLADELGPLVELISHKLKYQQDNASIHTRELMRVWFEQEGIHVYSLASKSTDSDIAEKVWALLKRHFDRLPKQPGNFEELRTALMRGWVEVVTTELCNFSTLVFLLA